MMKITFCGIEFNILNIDAVFERMDEDKVKCISTANAQFIVLANNDKRFRDYLNSNYVTFDGEVPLKIARLLNRGTEIEKISGSDLIYDFCDYAKKHSLSLFLLGGDNNALNGAVKNIRNNYQIEVEGFSPKVESYPFSDHFIEECKERLSAARPDILFVCLGTPKQEFFIEDLQNFLSALGVKYAIGSGGMIDFVSGRIKRAPKWVQNMGMEGVYRLIREPSKKRFDRLILSAKFFKYVFAHGEK